MKYGFNTFKCTYTPTDTANYNIITGLDVTIKVTEKLSVNIEEYVSKMTEDEHSLTKIKSESSLEELKKHIKTNGTITIYDSNGTKVIDNKTYAKTGMKLKIKTELEEIIYTIVVEGDNNGDGKFNAIDLLKLARYLVKLDRSLEKEYLEASNVYQDKDVDQLDLLKMTRILSNLEQF